MSLVEVIDDLVSKANNLSDAYAAVDGYRDGGGFNGVLDGAIVTLAFINASATAGTAMWASSGGALYAAAAVNMADSGARRVRIVVV